MSLGDTPFPFTFLDVTYQVAKPEFDVELAFQARHEDFALRKVAQHRKARGEREHQSDLERVWRDINGNLFAFGGELSLRYLLSDAGMKEYVCLLFQAGAAKHGGAAADMQAVEKMRASPEVWEELTAKVIQRDFPFLVKGQEPTP